MRFLSKVPLYLLRVGLAVSILVNIIFLGESNQTTSARQYELKRRGYPNFVWLIDFIAEKVFGDHCHCLKAWINWRLIKITLDQVGYKLW